MTSSHEKWVPSAAGRVEVLGLPWFGANTPELWRLPRKAMNAVPEGVRKQARFPAGARLRFRSDTSRLSLRVESLTDSPGHGIDVYVDGAYWRSVRIAEPKQTLECFSDAGTTDREITLYLPYRQEVRVPAIGLDEGATLGAGGPFSRTTPLVLYGSSIAQGAGASRAAMSYVALLARRLNLDFVNLGFGGAGKAEAAVVELVASVDACCYVFDLGKSYGAQSGDAYAAMLDTARAARPGVPMVCVTPVLATREFYSAEYVELSRHVLDVMRNAAAERAANDDKLHLLEGTDLLGPSDTDGFSADGVHPNDLGFALIAQRLEERIRDLVSSEATEG